VRTVSIADVLDNLLVEEARVKHAEISTGPSTFFVHVRLPDHVAEDLRAVQRKVLPDTSQHAEIDHITLAYVPKPADAHAPDKVHTALDALRAVGATTEPINAKIQGWAYFDGAGKPGKPNTALVALLDAPGLEHLHVDMVRALDQAGVPASDRHSFTPHMTFGYLGEHGRAPGELPPLQGRFTIDKVHVAARDHHEIPLTGASMGQKAAAAAWTDKIPGGLSDGKTPADFAPAKLEQGRKVEQEHTSSRPIATEIAMDHLTEDPAYYAKLKTIEKAAELGKAAARAGMRAIQQHVGAGNFAAANHLATTPGVLKPSAAGSQIRHLGSGMEGTSTLVAHPVHGLAVRKVYDSQGISGPAMVARKAEAGRALRDNPNVAQFKGELPTQAGPAHFYEHVPGHAGSMAHGTPSSAEIAQGVRAQGAGGMRLHDVHEGNVVGNKVVDYLPIKPGAPTGLRTDVMERAEAAQAAGRHGVPHAFTNYLKDPARPGNLMAQAFRGAPPLIQEHSPDYKQAALGVCAAQHANHRGTR
jgi:2'-5' RNA ligase